MTPPISGEERRKVIEYIKQGKITGLLEAIILSMRDTAETLISLLNQPTDQKLREQLAVLERKNDTFTTILHDQILTGIFLSIPHFDLKLVYDKIDAITDNYQRAGHRLGLIPLSDWIVAHLKVMLHHSISQLDLLLEMLRDSTLVPEKLSEISTVENKADESHALFLKQLYAAELEFKEHIQSEFLDLTIENIIDDLERLGKTLKTILKEIKISSEDLPPYLK